MIGEVLRDFLHDMPGLSFAAITSRETPLSSDVPFTRYDAEDHPALLEQYLAHNRSAFPLLPLAGWVLTDVFLLPTAIAVLMRGDEIRASWVGIPTLVPGRIMGVSMFAVERGCGAWAKLWGAHLLGARQIRGVVQLGAPAIRTHTRLGPMRVIGPAPGPHELAARSFVYQTDLDPSIIAATMHGHRGRVLGVTDELPEPGQLIVGLDASGRMQVGELPVPAS